MKVAPGAGGRKPIIYHLLYIDSCLAQCPWMRCHLQGRMPLMSRSCLPPPPFRLHIEHHLHGLRRCYSRLCLGILDAEKMKVVVDAAHARFLAR